jgi:hypothetical protein
MKLSPIVKRLRDACPSFSRRVYGSAKYAEVAELQEKTKTGVPCAFVVKDDDDPDQPSTNTLDQNVAEHFAVILGIDNSQADEPGLTSVDAVHDLRHEVFEAILGVEPDADHSEIYYTQGKVLACNRARLFYLLGFSAKTVIEPMKERLNRLPPLLGIDLDVDAIDPADPNLHKPGPDTRIDARIEINLESGG